MKHRSKVFVALSVAFCLLLAGCSTSPPSDISSRANALETLRSEARTVLSNERSGYDTEIKKSEYSFMEGYTADQKHQTDFDVAAAKLDEADKVYEEQVKKTLDDYEDAKLSALQSSVETVERLVGEAKALAPQPTIWIKQVLDLKKDPQKIISLVSATQVANVSGQENLQQQSDTAKKDWTKQVQTIDTRLAETASKQRDAQSKFDDLKAELSTPSPNFAVANRLRNDAEASQTTYVDSKNSLSDDLRSLYYAETQTLLDIRIDAEIDISRTSWNEGSDANTDQDYEYPTITTSDGEVISHFAQFTPGTMIASDGSWGDFKMENGADRALWDRLGIDSRKDWNNSSWSGHDSAEYYLDEMEVTYCHKLFVLRDGKPDTNGKPLPQDNACDKYTSPTDISEGKYWDEADTADIESIGMDIYSKGVGDFPDQATEVASPPGIVYVGNPQYGEMKTDSNGNEFWQFYFQYLIFQNLIGGPNNYLYSREYRDWNDRYRYNDQPFYSTVGGSTTPRFGADSPQTSSRFPGSTFASSNLANPSIRNAGPLARSGGPGGGGK